MAGAMRGRARGPAFMQAPPTSSAAKAMRILVNGASAFVATRLVAQLRSQCHNVVAFDLEPPHIPIEGVDHDQEDVHEALAPELGAGAERIYTSPPSTIRRPPCHAYYETHVLGAVNGTALAEACGLETLVSTSSISVYAFRAGHDREFSASPHLTRWPVKADGRGATQMAGARDRAPVGHRESRRRVRSRRTRQLHLSSVSPITRRVLY